MRSFVVGAVALTFATASSAALGAMQLQYTFDEPSGQALDTGAGAPSNGDLLNGAARSTNTPSGAGSAVNFPPEAGAPFAHVLSTDATKLDGLSQVTLTTWLNVRTYTSGNHRLVAKQAATTFGGFNFSLNATPNDGPVGPDNFRVGMFIGNNVSSAPANFGSAFSTADVDASSKWVFLAVTYDNSVASGNTRFYIGGVGTPVTQLGGDVTLPQITIDGGTARFGVGFTDAAATSNTSVDGLQDDVRVYDQALGLEALEVVRLANVPEPASLATLGLTGATLLMPRRGHRA